MVGLGRWTGAPYPYDCPGRDGVVGLGRRTGLPGVTGVEQSPTSEVIPVRDKAAALSDLRYIERVVEERGT